MADDRALLLEYAEWYKQQTEHYYEPRLNVDRFLATRAQPCSLCQDDPERRPHCQCSLPPAPPAERFWRVFQCGPQRWVAFTDDGHYCHALAHGRATRELAEADGRRSGLPKYDGGVK